MIKFLRDAVFGERPDFAGAAAAMARGMLEHAADPINDDALYYEWCDGPGKEYPTHTEMMRRIEGAPLEPFEMMNDGWEKAFYEWAAQRRATATKRAPGADDG